MGDDIYGLSLIPAVTSYTKYTKVHILCSIYQTTKYKTKMQWLKYLWKQINIY